MPPLTNRPYANRLMLLSSLAFSSGCGDAVRGPEYLGESPLQIHYRFPAPVRTLVPDGNSITLWLQDIHGQGAGQHDTALHPIEQEGVFEVPVNFLVKEHGRVPATSFRGPVVFLLHAAVVLTSSGISLLPHRPGPVAALDHWLIFQPWNLPTEEPGEETVPVALRRWPVGLPRGYSLVRRTCPAEAPVQFERVPKTTVVDLRTVVVDIQTVDPGASDDGPNFDLEAYDATFFRSCGLPPPPPLPGMRISDHPASELAFAPDSDTLFVLHLPPEAQPLSFAPTVSTWSPGRDLSPIATGVFRGRLQVGARNTVTIDGFDRRAPIVLQLSPGPTPGAWTTRPLPVPADALLSPKGGQLAFVSGPLVAAQLMLHEIASGTTRPLGAGAPLAWSPDGTQLLIRGVAGPTPLFLQTLDGSPPMSLPLPPSPERAEPPSSPHTETSHYLFGAGGPLLVQRRGERARYEGEPDDPFFLRLHPTLAAVDLAAARDRIFLDGQRGLVPDQFALTPDRRSLLAWTVTCPGLANNYCAAELHRIALEDGSDQIVLRTRRPGPVALGRDGHTLAVSGPDGVFVTTLP